MATKGDKAVLSPQAMRLYADGITLSAISEQLGVSVTTLSKWKAESKKPGADMDEWDRARAQKQGNIQRLRNLFEQQLSYCEELHPSERTSREMDALAKIGSLLEKWDKLEKAQSVAAEVEKVVVKAGLPTETAEDIRRQILGIGE